ncbi:MAG: hypothetical protein IJJ33_18420 [Victivallales bacterium]|nr:hypothetical protein [Victivallales bacterium]
MADRRSGGKRARLGACLAWNVPRHSLSRRHATFRKTRAALCFCSAILLLLIGAGLLREFF